MRIRYFENVSTHPYILHRQTSKLTLKRLCSTSISNASVSIMSKTDWNQSKFLRNVLNAYLSGWVSRDQLIPFIHETEPSI